MNKILVLGATGNVGSLVAKELAEKGYKAKAAVRDFEKAKTLLGDDVELVKFDYSDPSTFTEALDNVSHVFGIAPPSSPNSDKIVIPLLNAAKELNVKHVTFMTAMGIDQEEASPLRKLERHIMASGFSYSFLRPNWFNQNFNSIYLDQIKNQKGIFLPVNDAKTSFIDARDIAAVAVQTIIDEKHSDKEYTLTGPRAYDHNEAMAIISDVVGETFSFTPISDDDFRHAMKEIGYPEDMTEFMIEIYGMVKAGFTSGIFNDVKDVLGREPISFEQYARDYQEFWK